MPFVAFWRAPIGRNRSRVAIVPLLSGCLLAQSARFWQFSLTNLTLYNKNNRKTIVLLCQALCVIGFLGDLTFKLHISPKNVIVVVNIKFPRATKHTIVPSTEELYCLII